MYFGQRWYNPVVGRWTTPDPLGMVDGPNLYAYLNNDPLNSIDPWGLCEGTGFGGWDLIFDLSTFSDSLKLFQISNGDIGLQVLAIAGMTAVPADALGGPVKNIGKKIVIGETMKLVKARALKEGAEFYKARKNPAVIGVEKALRNNYQWLRSKVGQGYEIIDNGIDPTRQNGRSIFYAAEKRWSKLWGK